MVKIGRNELCHCGSGKKYKKCCIDKEEPLQVKDNVPRTINFFLTYEEVNELSTNEIIHKIGTMGIPFDQTVFLDQMKEFYSAEQISENWFKKYDIIAKGRWEDFPWLAAWILWERLAPTDILSLEQMDDLIEAGYDNLNENDSIGASDQWLKVWEALKYRFKPSFKNLDYLDKQYSGSFFISNFCQDLEMELHNAGLKDPIYLEKRIHYCREFCDYFPEESELVIHNMKRAIAESYAMLRDYEKAKLEFSVLVEEFPDNPWGYIGWGDMFFLGHEKDYYKAKDLYMKGLAVAKDKDVIGAVQERLEDLASELEVD